MKAYSNYKDSGVQWIGKVPSHWNMAKLKYDFHIYESIKCKWRVTH